MERAWASSIFEDLLVREVSPAPASSGRGLGGHSVGISIERGINHSSFGWWMSECYVYAVDEGVRKWLRERTVPSRE